MFNIKCVCVFQLIIRLRSQCFSFIILLLEDKKQQYHYTVVFNVGAISRCGVHFFSKIILKVHIEFVLVLF